MPNQHPSEILFYETISNYIQQRELGFRYSILAQPNLAEYTSIILPIRWIPDFIILKGAYPYVVVEVTSPSKFDRQNYLDNFLATDFRFDLELVGADYLVITDNERVIIIGRQDEEPRQTKPLNEIFELFNEDLSDTEIEGLKQQVEKVIRSVVEQSDLPQKLGQDIQRFIRESSLNKNIEFDKNGRFFHFRTNIEKGLNDYENQFFQALLEPVVDQTICRYTTLETLFHTIGGNSYRMASHIAMNDRGEVDYVDKYIGEFYTPLANMSLGEVQKLNRSYISSCTTVEKEDDLTMYRLYGEDSKGVCLCFNVTNGLLLNNLIVKKISYARRDGVNPALDIIKEIVSILSGSYKLRFRFQYLDVWKHFFKSFDYAVEQEVRILYFDDRISVLPNEVCPTGPGWILAQPDKILSKYLMFDLTCSNFPLKLYKIILGPNCPEKTLNKRQFEAMLDDHGIANVVVQHSRIESYRRS